jgi:UPF0271 protein
MKAAMQVDLNIDVGEGAGHDAALMSLVSSANIACGGHAGDDDTMRTTVALARRHGVAIGAHPGHRDRVHAGRRPLPISPAAAADLVLGQIERLAAVAGGGLHHVKLHGALYHQAEEDAALATAVAAALGRAHPRLAVYALAGGRFAAAARACGLAVADEAFLDRQYADTGALVPRDKPGALVTEPAAAAARAVELVRTGRVRAAGGRDLAIRADTLCIHGDGPSPLALAHAVRQSLAAAGIEVVAAVGR